MNILVTGGTGFVGQHLIKELGKKKDNNISVICRKRRKRPYIDIEKLPNVAVHYGTNILDYENLQRYFKGIDIVFNLAGYVSFKQADKNNLISINRDGTLNVMRACEKYGIKKLIHVSSTAALGFGNNIIDENHDFDWSRYKRCVYSFSKHLPNKHIMESKCDSVIVYPSLILGPGDTANTSKLLNMVKKRKLPFTTTGRNSVIDVRDLVKAFILLMEEDVRNERFIVAGENYSFKNMHSIIAQELGVKPRKQTVHKAFLYPLLGITLLLERISNNPLITYENIFHAFQNRVHSSDKISKLGFKPKYTLDRTVRDSWKWMEEMKKE